MGWDAERKEAIPRHGAHEMNYVDIGHLVGVEPGFHTTRGEEMVRDGPEVGEQS